MSPLLVCLTATRNYGWVTRAFLEANSRWADYIIVVDQMSTDGTREVCAEYNNVIVLDDSDLSYSETRRCMMALNCAREIKGDKILVYLAIDEILPANWKETKDGELILSSRPTEMFILNWANLLPDRVHYKATNADNMYRIFHDDGITPYDNGGLDMHTHCLPYCYNGTEHVVEDFPILHFGLYNTLFQFVKLRFYQMVDFDKNNKSVVKLSRYYHREIKNVVEQGDFCIKKDWLWGDFDVFNLVDINSRPILCDEIESFFEKEGVKRYIKLDIWDKKMLDLLSIDDPRPIWIKLLHAYFHASSRFQSTLFVRMIDYVLKLFL